MIRVLLVCTGNICRSPMAEGVFRDMVEKAGLSDKIHIESAGTGPWHVGERAHHGTRRILEQKGIQYDERAQQMSRADLSRYDYILGMDESHMRNIRRLGDTDAETRRFLSYANDAKLTTETEIPDPYYSGKFDLVYELVEVGSRALLDHIRKQHNL
jgi:protein-tyrosine phosphatase